jgi:hypothetical protein
VLTVCPKYGFLHSERGVSVQSNGWSYVTNCDEIWYWRIYSSLRVINPFKPSGKYMSQLL